MGSARDEFLQKSNEYLEHFEACKGTGYESPEYQKHFQMADDLIRYIIEHFQSQSIDGKDLYQSKIDLDQLFRGSKDEALKKQAGDIQPELEAAIKKFIEGNNGG